MHTLKELKALPTLCQAQTSDLKIEDYDRGIRIWLSRCGVEDGEPYSNKVTVEKYDGRQWIVDREYQAI